MKLALFDDRRIGIVEGENVIDITDVITVQNKATGIGPLVEIAANIDIFRPVIERSLDFCPRIPLTEASLLPPVPRPGKIMAMGSNYLEGTKEKPLPIWAFFKSPNAVIGPFDTIILPPVDARIFHHEAELVAVVGKRGKSIQAEYAQSYICGYMAGIDVSGRFSHLPHSIFNKSHDTFAPIGPWLVTADEIQNPHSLEVRLSVNDELRQNFNTNDMGHNIWDSVAYLSAVTTLDVGDIIFTGTNHQGLGALQDGDAVRLEIEGVGVLWNHVVDPQKRVWPRGIDQEIGRRVLEMLRTGKPPGAN
jgi:2-keto-4-pentenoate hydratase/2-oxohepta-3-ene-1,7-dioic acid hydratase in catechol pathway